VNNGSPGANAETVVVAMSGGVDSSVAAARLCRDGRRVIGVTLRMHTLQETGSLRPGCGGTGSEERARAVAAQLHIPHHILDCSREFENLVLHPAWNEYAAGRTPSPCLGCNEQIKFGLLLSWSRRMGAAKLATGHYARIVQGCDHVPMLLRGIDTQKDQSYFLAGLSREQLVSILFPLGDMTKKDVRDMARAIGLSCADTSESQDACFSVPGQTFPDILRERFDGAARPGKVLDESGGQLGQHDGIHRFTVGQRRGFGIAASGPMWVKEIRPGDAAIILTPDKDALFRRHLIADDINWLADEPGQKLLECCVQVRYRHRAQPAGIRRLPDGGMAVAFREPVRAITPGQAAVFYSGDRVLGRGWIRSD
jgi:tRNA-uridine 2-sulfurtransferase